jgi:hypothetical protein
MLEIMIGLSVCILIRGFRQIYDNMQIGPNLHFDYKINPQCGCGKANRITSLVDTPIRELNRMLTLYLQRPNFHKIDLLSASFEFSWKVRDSNDASRL